MLYNDYFSDMCYGYKVLKEHSILMCYGNASHYRNIQLEYKKLTLPCGSILYTYDNTIYAIVHRDKLYTIDVVGDESCSFRISDEKRILKSIKASNLQLSEIICSAKEWHELLKTVQKEHKSPILFVDNQLKNYA